MTIPAILTARAYARKRFEQFLTDYADLKRNITTEAMRARGLTSGHKIARDFRNPALNERSESE
ncbi:MAG: hypothetical protein E6Z13_00140 [Dermabacter sp.]|nr:hypothetical protein [Dermabacter sp.]